jgi:hypothetical protein
LGVFKSVEKQEYKACLAASARQAQGPARKDISLKGLHSGIFKAANGKIVKLWSEMGLTF